MPLEVEVVALSDGQFTYDGPMYAGLTGDLGPSAWLRHAGVNVVVVSARMQPLDQAFARSLGIDCAAMQYIAVKSAVHFRSGFEKIAGSIHNIDAQAIPHARLRPAAVPAPAHGRCFRWNRDRGEHEHQLDRAAATTRAPARSKTGLA